MLTLFDEVVYMHGGHLYREGGRDKRDVWYWSRFMDGPWRGPFTCSVKDWEDFVRFTARAEASG